MVLSRAIFAWLLAALWLPAASHCALEDVGLLANIQDTCCSAEHAGDAKTGQHCSGDACANVEGGVAKQSVQVVKLSPTLLIVVGCWVQVSEPESESLLESYDVGDAADALPNTWQFAARAALSPRAPSLS